MTSSFAAFFDRFKPLVFVLVIYFAYRFFVKNTETFRAAPYNVHSPPKTDATDKSHVENVNDTYTKLVKLINDSTFDIPYKLDDFKTPFLDLLNTQGLGTFSILSVGQESSVSLINVLIQDNETYTVYRFPRVDFIVNSLNPFKIQRIVITPDLPDTTVRNLEPVDELRDDKTFRISNPLHLFYPYATSDNEMALTPNDLAQNQNLMVAKGQMLKSLENALETQGMTPATDHVQHVGQI